MKYFDFEILGLKRKLPYVKVADNLALASFVCLSDTELVQRVAPELVKRLPEVDVLMTAEAKGICLTYEMSRIMGMKEFVVARKSCKPYMQNVVSHTLRSITTQKEQTLYLDGVEADKIRGKRVAIIDDVIATGESLQAIENLAVEAGAKVVARAAILAELESVDRKDIIYLKEHYVFRPNPDGTFTRSIRSRADLPEAFGRLSGRDVLILPRQDGDARPFSHTIFRRPLHLPDMRRALFLLILLFFGLVFGARAGETVRIGVINHFGPAERRDFVDATIANLRAALAPRNMTFTDLPRIGPDRERLVRDYDFLVAPPSARKSPPPTQPHITRSLRRVPDEGPKRSRKAECVPARDEVPALRASRPGRTLRPSDNL